MGHANKKFPTFVQDPQLIPSQIIKAIEKKRKKRKIERDEALSYLNSVSQSIDNLQSFLGFFIPSDSHLYDMCSSFLTVKVRRREMTNVGVHRGHLDSKTGFLVNRIETVCIK